MHILVLFLIENHLDSKRRLLTYVTWHPWHMPTQSFLDLILEFNLCPLFRLPGMKNMTSVTTVGNQQTWGKWCSFVALKVFYTVHLKRDLDSLINWNLIALHISFFPLISLFTVCKISLREELWGTLHLNSRLSQYFLAFWSLCTYLSPISILAHIWTTNSCCSK
jgi:hypothetical protein